MSNRDPTGKDFDPSSFDDVLALVGSWTSQGAMTAPQIVERLRARGVVVRATTSGRHVIVESRRQYPGEPAEAKMLVVPATPHHTAWPGRDRDPSAPLRRLIRPPGQALHRVAALFGKHTRERILEPIIADMQLEYCDALAAEPPRPMKLWLVQARAWIAFAEAIFLKTVVGRIIKGISRMV